MTLEELLIRKGEEDDIPQVLKLIIELATYEKAPHEVKVSTESMLKDGFGLEKIYDFLVAEWKGEVIGTAIFFNKYSTWKGRCVYLDDIIVHEPFRGKGIGTLLMQEVINEAKRRKAARLEWQVLDWNKPAIRFYEKFHTQFDSEWINCKLSFTYE